MEKIEFGGKVLQNKYGSCVQVRNSFDEITMLIENGSGGSDKILGPILKFAPRKSSLTSKFISSYDSFVSIDIESLGFASADQVFMASLFYVGKNFSLDNARFELLFARNPNEEGALLARLFDVLREDYGVITFNGRSFDNRIISSRMKSNGIPFEPKMYDGNGRNHPKTIEEGVNSYLGERHFDVLADLLRPNKTSSGLSSLGLQNAEKVLLGYRRAHDFPGGVIVKAYANYLGYTLNDEGSLILKPCLDFREDHSSERDKIERSMRHNVIDVVTPLSIIAKLSGKK